MTFERTTDTRLIRSFLTEPRCYRRMANDSAPPIAEFRVGYPLPIGITYVVGVEYGAEAEALFLLCDTQEGPSVAEVHFCIIPEAWGRTVEIARAFLEWVWRETRLKRLIGKVPGYNRLAKRLAERVGFVQYGVSVAPIQKHGKMFQVNLLEIRRPRVAA